MLHALTKISSQGLLMNTLITNIHEHQKGYFSYITKSFMVLLVLFTFSHTSLAGTSAQAKWFRYYENGVPQMSQTITEKHLKLGYEELDSSFRVIKKVTPYSKAEAEAKKAAEKEKKVAASKVIQAQNKLIKTYSTSSLAIRKRKELLGDIQSKRSFAQQQLFSANDALNKELKKAGNLEKRGKAIPDTLKKNIQTKRAAVEAVQESINDLMINQMKRVHQITQDIRRLRKIENATQN